MLKNDLSLVLEKRKIIHEITKIYTISSTDEYLKVDDKRKSVRKWFQYLGIQNVYFVKETTEKMELNRHLNPNPNIQKSVLKY